MIALAEIRPERLTGYFPYDIINLYIIIFGVHFITPPVQKGGTVMPTSAYRAPSMPGMKDRSSIEDVLRTLTLK